MTDRPLFTTHEPGFRGIDELAARLNVPTSTAGPIIRIAGCSGNHYDLTALIHAVLDKLEQANA